MDIIVEKKLVFKFVGLTVFSLIEQGLLSKTDTRVLASIINNMPYNARYTPKQSYVAEKTGLTVANVSKSYDHLCHHLLLRRIKRGVYLLNPNDIWAGDKPERQKAIAIWNKI